MKHIKLFENFNKSELEIELRKCGIENYTINDDGTIDVDGNVDLSKSLGKLDTLPFKFGKVTGSFDLYYNNLTSLVGSPYYVGGYFDCSYNNLKNLEGSPVEVDGNFYCHNNRIESLEGMSLEIGKSFYCTGNKFKELNSLSNIEGTIYCDQGIDSSKFQGFCKKIAKR